MLNYCDKFMLRFLVNVSQVNLFVERGFKNQIFSIK